jgi:hypothetical protein
MPHIAMGAVAIGAVVFAGLMLIYMSRHAHEHPGALLALLIGAPVLLALAFFVARRLRRH